MSRFNLATLRHSPFVRFLGSSGLVTLLDYALYLGLSRVIAPEAANVISVTSAMLANFALQRWFVFKGTFQALWLSFLISMSLSGVGMLLSTGIIYVIRLAWPEAVLVPKLIATGIVFFWNFLSKKYLAFPVRT